MTKTLRACPPEYRSGMVALVRRLMRQPGEELWLRDEVVE
jgi:hypothetical protein